MSQSSALILLGLLTFVTPFAGLTPGIQQFLFALFGIAVFAIGFSMRAKKVKDMSAKSEATTASGTSSFETTSNSG